MTFFFIVVVSLVFFIAGNLHGYSNAKKLHTEISIYAQLALMESFYDEFKYDKKTADAVLDRFERKLKNKNIIPKDFTSKV